MRSLLPLAALTLFPVARVPKLWLIVWLSERPRAWDGTGHYGVAQIYNRVIFPDTFGWTHAYFGGMPLSNFYPPLFYWLVALLHHTLTLIRRGVQIGINGPRPANTRGSMGVSVGDVRPKLFVGTGGVIRRSAAPN